MTRIIDFDAFRAEQKKEPIELRIGGRVYQLPPSLPTAVALDAVRLNKTMKGDAEVPVEDLDKMGASVFGRANWDSITVDASLTVDEMGELFKQVLALYTGGSTPEEPADPLA